MLHLRLTIVLLAHEMDALNQLAQKELRRPRDQAAYMLRQALYNNDIDDLRKRIERLEELVDALSIPMPTVYGGKDG